MNASILTWQCPSCHTQNPIGELCPTDSISENDLLSCVNLCEIKDGCMNNYSPSKCPDREF